MKITMKEQREGRKRKTKKQKKLYPIPYLGKFLVGENFRHLPKISSLFPDEKFDLCFGSL